MLNKTHLHDRRNFIVLLDYFLEKEEKKHDDWPKVH